MELFRVFMRLIRHPLNRDAKMGALMRFVRWQIASRLLGTPVILPFVVQTRLLMQSGMTGATGNWYCGLIELDEMGFVLHFLRPDDLFIDVGANVGVYSVLASGAVQARSIAIEPVPSTFAKLRENIHLNNLDDGVAVHCCGLSSHVGELAFISDADTMNRVSNSTADVDTIQVPVTTMDILVDGQSPRLIKIDVEGHEADVLAGASRTLENPSLEAILLETCGLGDATGGSDEQLVELVQAFGFTACRYDAIKRELTPNKIGRFNTIFVRDVEAAQRTCKAAQRRQLVNATI